METLASRIRWILEHRSLSAQALSEKAGLAPGHVGHMLNGRVGEPRRKTIVAIANAGEVNVGWLADGIGTPESSVADPTLTGPEALPPEMPETLGQRKDYARQEIAAKKKLAADGEPVDDWVWPHVRATNNFTLANTPPSVAMLCELAKVIAAHGDPSVAPRIKSK